MLMKKSIQSVKQGGGGHVHVHTCVCVCESVYLFDGKTENGSKMTCAMLTKIYQLTQKSNLFLSGLIWQCFIIPR